MTYVLHMGIAGIRFAVRSLHPIVPQVSATAYESFLFDASGGAGRAEIDVELIHGQMPSMHGLLPLFDSGQAWTLFADGDRRYLALNAPARSDSPLWLAHFGCDPTQVTVFCSDALIVERDGAMALSNPVCYPLDQLLLMYALAWRSGLLLHAAGACVHGHGLIFPGRSGAGKSTLSLLLNGQSDISLLSDDRMAVRKTGSSFRAFGTPWPGNAGIAINRGMPLSAVLFLRHADHSCIEAISSQEALERLLPVASILWYERQIVPTVLSWCEGLFCQIPAFELRLRPDPEVVNLLRELVAVC
jgi:hypothetical protein